MKNAIVNIITFGIACMVVHFLVGLSTVTVMSVAMGIFLADLFLAIKNNKE